MLVSAAVGLGENSRFDSPRSCVFYGSIFWTDPFLSPSNSHAGHNLGDTYQDQGEGIK